MVVKRLNVFIFGEVRPNWCSQTESVVYNLNRVYLHGLTEKLAVRSENDSALSEQSEVIRTFTWVLLMLS